MQRVMLYDQILLKMAGIRLIVIVCVLLMYSDNFTKFFTEVFLMHLDYLHSNEAVTLNKMPQNQILTFLFS